MSKNNYTLIEIDDLDDRYNDPTIISPVFRNPVSLFSSCTSSRPYNYIVQATIRDVLSAIQGTPIFVGFNDKEFRQWTKEELLCTEPKKTQDDFEFHLNPKEYVQDKFNLSDKEFDEKLFELHSSLNFIVQTEADAYRARNMKEHEYKNFKKKIPCVTWSSKFRDGDKRGSNSPADYTGVFYMDIDKIEDPEKAKEIISDIPSVLATWVSLSGKGVGILFQSENITQEHFNEAKRLIEEKGFKIDNSVRDMKSRLNIISYDPNIYVNANPETLKVDLKFEEPTNRISKEILQGMQKDDTQRIFDIATQRVGPIGPHNYSNFMASYVGLMIRGSYSYETIERELLARSEGMHKEERIKKLKDLYARYSASNNQYTNEDYHSILEPLIQDFYSNPDYTLDNRSYLDSLGLNHSDINRKVIVSKPGTGKTHFASNLKEKIIIVQPTINLLKEQYKTLRGEKKSVQMFYGEEKAKPQDLFNRKNQIILTTYHSLPNLVHILENLPERETINEWGVIFDEAHIIIEKASVDFMNTELNNVLSVIQYAPFKFMTMLTATPFVMRGIPGLEQFQNIVVDSENRINTTRYEFKTKSPHQDAFTLIDKKIKEGEYIIVCYNNTRTTTFDVELSSRGYDFTFLNSKVKNNQKVENFVKSGTLPGDGIVTTSVSEMGQSFNLPEGHSGKVSVIFVDPRNWSSRARYQISQRTRNAKDISVYEFQKTYHGTKQTTFNSIFLNASDEAAYEANEFTITAYHNKKVRTERFFKGFTESMNDESDWRGVLFIQESPCKIGPNYLAIKQWDECRRDRIITSSQENLRAMWGAFGVDTVPIDLDSPPPDPERDRKISEEKERIRSEKEESKKITRSTLTEMFSSNQLQAKKIKEYFECLVSMECALKDVVHTSFDTPVDSSLNSFQKMKIRTKNLIKRFWNEKFNPEWSTRYNLLNDVIMKIEEVRSLSDCISVEDALNITIKYFGDDRGWKQALGVIKSKNSLNDTNEFSKEILENIMNTFKVGDVLTSEEIQNKINDCFNNHSDLKTAGIKRNITKHRASIWLKQIWQTSSKTIRKGSKAVHTVKIEGLAFDNLMIAVA